MRFRIYRVRGLGWGPRASDFRDRATPSRGKVGCIRKEAGITCAIV